MQHGYFSSNLTTFSFGCIFDLDSFKFPNSSTATSVTTSPPKVDKATTYKPSKKQTSSRSTTPSPPKSTPKKSKSPNFSNTSVSPNRATSPAYKRHKKAKKDGFPDDMSRDEKARLIFESDAITPMDDKVSFEL